MRERKRFRDRDKGLKVDERTGDICNICNGFVAVVADRCISSEVGR